MLHTHKIFNGIWQINPTHVHNYLPLIISHIKGNATPHNEPSNPEPPGVPTSNQQNLTAIFIAGAITKYDRPCEGEGTLSIARYLTEELKDPNTHGVILVIDSPGGESSAWHHVTDVLLSEQRTKPVLAYISDCACSAAYAIACACDGIIANKEACIGSIGTYCTLIDFSAKLEKEGIKVIDVYASLSTRKNAEFKDALQGNTDPLQEKIDEINKMFTDHVVACRNFQQIDEQTEAPEWATGRIYTAQQALEAELIDGIDTFQNIHKYFL